MSPADGHLHHASRLVPAAAARRSHRGVARRRPNVDRRLKAWPVHARLTMAESPELYMREEMI